jgi:sphingosine-1-phosphate phosphatase 1
MGNEMFFLTFFPIIILGLDAEVARRTMVCWAAIYYIGQVLKDALRLPRPPVSAKLSQAHLCAACPARCG